MFIFGTDSLYFNFDGTNDSVSGFDTTKYFVSWKDTSVKKHSEAIKAWQSLDTHNSLRIARFECDGVNYAAAFNPVITGDDGTDHALVIPSASLPTLFRSKSVEKQISS